MLAAHSKIFDMFTACAEKVITPEEKLNTWEWSEKYITLSDKSSSNPGSYDASLTPFWKKPMEWFCDPYVRQLTGMKSVQIGGTQWMINCMQYSIPNLRLPMLYVGQTEADVKKFVKNKYDPVAEECPPVSALRGNKKTAWNEREYTTCSLFMGWGSSPNALASSSIGALFLDEVDKYKQKDKTEPHPFDLGMARVTAFPDTYKALVTSTPTIPTGIVNREFLKGSQHKYHVPCPHCQHKQELKFASDTLCWPEDCRDEKGEWDLDRVEAEAYYVCQNSKCGKHITEDDRYMMVQKGEWVQTNMNAPRAHISFHISAFVSPFLTFGKIAKWFLSSKDTPNGLKNFYTQCLGLPFQEKAISNDEKTVKKLQESTPFKYIRSHREKRDIALPFRPLYICTTVDVQGDHFWIMQCAFTKDGHCAILDWEKIHGYSEVDAWSRRIYSFKGNRYTSRINLIDSGFEAKATGGVYQFVISQKGRWLPCVGRDNKFFEVFTKRIINFRGVSFELYSFQDPYFKEEIYQNRMTMKVPEQLWLPEVIDNVLINQITDEQLVEKPTPDGMAMKWIPKFKNNHLGDCLKIATLIWEVFGAAKKQEE